MHESQEGHKGGKRRDENDGGRVTASGRDGNLRNTQHGGMRLQDTYDTGAVCINAALLCLCVAFSARWQTSMPWIQGCLITSSMSERSFGLGSSIFRMSGLHARGERLLIVGGHADCDGVLHAATYAEKS